MKFRWSPAPPQPLLAGRLAAQLKIPPLLAQCLLNRGFSEPSAIGNFLSPRLKNLADPFLLPNLAAAVERLIRAREQNEPLVIFGDYDVDGSPPPRCCSKFCGHSAGRRIFICPTAWTKATASAPRAWKIASKSFP